MKKKTKKIKAERIKMLKGRITSVEEYLVFAEPFFGELGVERMACEKSKIKTNRAPAVGDIGYFFNLREIKRWAVWKATRATLETPEPEEI